jgi:hypothetical protein
MVVIPAVAGGEPWACCGGGVEVHRSIFSILGIFSPRARGGSSTKEDVLSKGQRALNPIFQPRSKGVGSCPNEQEYCGLLLDQKEVS